MTAEDRETLRSKYRGVSIKRQPRGSNMFEVSIDTHTRERPGIFETYELLQSPQTRALTGCKAFPIGTFESRSTGTPSAFEFCRKQIHDCFQNHLGCKVDGSKLPHCVVRVGKRTIGKFSPRLYETNNSEPGEYAALSHCWGPKYQIFMTTSKTLADRKSAILWSHRVSSVSIVEGT
jgi:hypothetical protein